MLIDPRSGLPRYVGSTCELRRRIAAHHSPSNTSNTPVGRWLRELREEGLRAGVEVLAVFYVHDDARDHEGRAIRWLKARGLPLLNERDRWVIPIKPESHVRQSGSALRGAQPERLSSGEQSR